MAFCFYSIGCCGFHILPVWGNSDYFESINNTLLSIALSYVAGYVIYLFTSALSRKQRMDEVFAIWSEHLSSTYEEMSERIEELRVFADIQNGTNDGLTLDDCKPLERYTSMSPMIYIKKIIPIDDLEAKITTLIIYDKFWIKKNLNDHHVMMHHYLDIMLDNPMAIDAERKILDVLVQIKS